jgi:endonuclease/exonuclease/phosphatase family metal-dependent hydrolase
MQGIDPPRGFAFAWFKIGNADIGVYSLHLKSNRIMFGNKEIETAKNIRKREVSIQQLLAHIHDVIGTVIPSIKGLVVGGDFNTNHDQPMFAAEKTLDTLTSAAYQSMFEGLPLEQRITHPGTHGFPDATFDYLFGKNVKFGKPIITQTNVSDHLPLTCDVVLKYWEIIADNLKKAGWSLGWVSAVHSEGRTIWIADAHRDDGKRYVVRADEKLTAFVELQGAIPEFAVSLIT